MELGIREATRPTRGALLLRSQVPLLASVALILVLLLALGVSLSAPGWLVVAVVILAVPAVACVVLPWERIPTVAQSVLAIVDLGGIVILAAALHGAVDHVSFLAAFPAVWLTMVGGVWGAAVGIVGAWVAAIVPLLTSRAPTGPVEWSSALVAPIVVSVFAVATVALARQADRSSESMRRALDERNRAAAESDRVGAMMRTFADEIDLGLAYVDFQGGEPFYNQALAEFSALAGIEGIIGYGTLVFEEDQVTAVDPQDQPLARMLRGEAITDRLFWVGRRGHQRALLCNGRPVHRSDGELAGVVIVVQDVTERLRSERSREDALATLAHELRTPLTSIVGYSELLSADPLPSAASARVDVIARNAEHLLALTSRFLDSLHPTPAVQRERVVVRELIEETLDMLLTMPGFAQRELSMEVGEHIAVVGDPDGLRTVLNCLLHNAAKFSRTGDRIRIAAGTEVDIVWLTVHNSGSRIDEPELERIFDRFYRGENARRAAIPGTGIGLSISREILHAHGGTLTAEPVDAGACLRATIPAGA